MGPREETGGGEAVDKDARYKGAARFVAAGPSCGCHWLTVSGRGERWDTVLPPPGPGRSGFLAGLASSGKQVRLAVAISERRGSLQVRARDLTHLVCQV